MTKLYSNVRKSGTMYLILSIIIGVALTAIGVYSLLNAIQAQSVTGYVMYNVSSTDRSLAVSIACIVGGVLVIFLGLINSQLLKAFGYAAEHIETMEKDVASMSGILTMEAEMLNSHSTAKQSTGESSDASR